MIRALARKARAFLLRPLLRRQEALALELGRLQAGLNAGRPIASLRDAEFQVFSQHGEDGVIQHLASLIALPQKSFVEFGVQDYSESNTRFLLAKDRWKGLVLDGGTAHLDYIHGESWLGQDRDLQAVQAWVTPDNVASLIRGAGFGEDFGLLSVDIDGNDYWVLQAALEDLRPGLLVLEYNALFGPALPLSVPRDDRFDRWKRHAGGLYFGASLAAMESLARSKNYALLGCESSGTNAFFVRQDLLSGLKPLSVKEAWVPSTPGAGRGWPSGLRALAGLPLTDVKSLQTQTISEWFGLD